MPTQIHSQSHNVLLVCYTMELCHPFVLLLKSWKENYGMKKIIVFFFVLVVFKCTGRENGWQVVSLFLMGQGFPESTLRRICIDFRFKSLVAKIACLKYRWYLSSGEPRANIRACVCSCLLVLQPAKDDLCECAIGKKGWVFVCSKEDIHARVCMWMCSFITAPWALGFHGNRIWHASESDLGMSGLC